MDFFLMIGRSGIMILGRIKKTLPKDNLIFRRGIYDGMAV